ncbi:uncharacterized protein [Aegilops tauschii subsp. strangulata]|uniref:uncharacterized protein n=1 Tax=Aegilops tauschii subsp. strangulata TaxID=200361 RepID=UPI001ABC4051|nr:uncharacterized protein LOC120974569 [Aegilops tauschii subsp. strangulata]
MVCSGPFLRMLGLKLLAGTPQKSHFERLIEMKKKLFLLGFTVEGFEQVGGVDSVIDIEDDEEFEGEGAAERQEDEGGNVQKDGLEDLLDSEGAIDELDKANITCQSKNKQKGAHADMFCSDSDHETFILECVNADKEEHLVTDKRTDLKDFCPSALMDSTPSRPLVKIVEGSTSSGGKLESMEYCESILKSVDFSESEEEDSKDDDLETLPPEAIQTIQNISLKRSLLETLDQAHDPPKAEKTKWGPVLVQKPTTRGHGNLNIMEKAAAYKWKQNLEIPKKLKGKRWRDIRCVLGQVAATIRQWKILSSETQGAILLRWLRLLERRRGELLRIAWV